jgi:hypothetical protein
MVTPLKSLLLDDDGRGDMILPPRHAALAAHRFGLSYSNSDASEEVLLRNALMQLRFYAILESCGVDGIEFVRAQIKHLYECGDIDDEHVVKLDRMLKSVEVGFAQGAAEKAANVKTTADAQSHDD